MLKRNLVITSKLAYVVTGILVIFLSSAFASLAHGAAIGGDTLNGTEGLQGQEPMISGYQPNNMDVERLKDSYGDVLDRQRQYRDRWEFRKSRLRLFEEYGRWVRDHEQSSSGFGYIGYGDMFGNSSPFLAPILPSFVDLIMSII